MVDNCLSLGDDMVLLSPHHATWHAAFEQEAAALTLVLGEHAYGIEHVGSTWMPSIRAKPILDILVGLGELGNGHDATYELATLGYAFRPNAGLPEEHVFVKGTPRTHILHVVEYGGAPWHQKLAFRDALREAPALAQDYEDLKASLCSQYAHDRSAYTAGKTEFVRSVVQAKVAGLPFRSRH